MCEVSQNRYFVGPKETLAPGSRKVAGTRFDHNGAYEGLPRIVVSQTFCVSTHSPHPQSP